MSSKDTSQTNTQHLHGENNNVLQIL